MPVSRALVIGCGGTVGGAWSIAALKALADQLDWDPRLADIMQGTSAGAEMVTMLGAGIGIDQMVEMSRGAAKDARLAAHFAAVPSRWPPRPGFMPGSPKLLFKAKGQVAASGLLPLGRGDADWLERLADSLHPEESWLPHPGARMVAMDYDSGARVVFGVPGAPEATVGEALRASWAIPGWLPPVLVGGRRFVDGGTFSTASVDLLLDDAPEEVFVIVSMATLSGARMPGLGGLIEQRVLRRQMTRRLNQEIAALRAAGSKVMVIDAGREDLHMLGTLGVTFMDDRNRLAIFEELLRLAGKTVERALSARSAA